MNDETKMLSLSNHMIETAHVSLTPATKRPLILWHHYRSIISILLRNAMKRAAAGVVCKYDRDCSTY